MTPDEIRSMAIEAGRSDPFSRFTHAEPYMLERFARLVAERERERCAKLRSDVERCYRMLISEPNAKLALDRAEEMLRLALADAGRD